MTISAILARAALTLVATAFVSTATAQTGGADLNLTPKRAVLEGAQRTVTFYVFNQGDAPATYAVGLTDRVMSADGAIAAVDPAAPDATPGFASARPMLAYTPRRFTLAPGESQAIRVRASAPTEPGAREWRTHMDVTVLPPETAGETVDQAVAGAPQGISVRLNTLFSISVPVIVRAGPRDVRAAVDAVEARRGPDGAPVAAVTLRREGAHSAYGDVEIRAAGTPDGAPPLAVARGLAVYTELTRRSLDVPLPASVRPGDRLEARFVETSGRRPEPSAPASFVAR